MVYFGWCKSRKRKTTFSMKNEMLLNELNEDFNNEATYSTVKTKIDVLIDLKLKNKLTLEQKTKLDDIVNKFFLKESNKTNKTNKTNKLSRSYEFKESKKLLDDEWIANANKAIDNIVIANNSNIPDNSIKEIKKLVNEDIVKLRNTNLEKQKLIKINSLKNKLAKQKLDSKDDWCIL